MGFGEKEPAPPHSASAGTRRSSLSHSHPSVPQKRPRKRRLCAANLMVVSGSSLDPMQERRREVLRQASVALQGRVVTVWEVSSRAEVIPALTSATAPQPQDVRLDLDTTLHRWGAP